MQIWDEIGSAWWWWWCGSNLASNCSIICLIIIIITSHHTLTQSSKHNHTWLEQHFCLLNCIHLTWWTYEKPNIFKWIQFCWNYSFCNLDDLLEKIVHCRSSSICAISSNKKFFPIWCVPYPSIVRKSLNLIHCSLNPLVYLWWWNWLEIFYPHC